MKAVVAAFNQEKALVGAFSVITNLRIAFVWSTTKNSSSPWLVTEVKFEVNQRNALILKLGDDNHRCPNTASLNILAILGKIGKFNFNGLT